MGDGIQIIEIIILAMFAAFIALRLRNVLGRRPDEPPATTPFSEKEPGQGKPAAGEDTPESLTKPVIGSYDLRKAGVEERHMADLRHIFGAMVQAGFSKFLAGAKRAYGQILEGFWKGDLEDMGPFLDAEILSQYKAAIAEREKRGEKLENRLVEILKVLLKEIHISRGKAEITLQFNSEIIAVLKNKEGRLIEGDLTDTITVTDIWTFSHDLKNKDPNWILISTEAG